MRLPGLAPSLFVAAGLLTGRAVAQGAPAEPTTPAAPATPAPSEPSPVPAPGGAPAPTPPAAEAPSPAAPPPSPAAPPPFPAALPPPSAGPPGQPGASPPRAEGPAPPPTASPGPAATPLAPAFAPRVPPPPSTAPAARPTGEADDPARRPPFRHTWIVWDHAVSTQTFGVGQSYLSSNPTYVMSGEFLPRYYPYDGVNDALYVDGRIDLVREFTNNDFTTRRGETTFSDATLVLGYARYLAREGDYKTVMSVRAPALTFPTSKFSADNGTVLGLGGEVRVAQQLPLNPEFGGPFRRVLLRAAVGYNHTFTRATTATNGELRRVRLDTDGRTVPGDQLTGIAFPEHELALRGRAFLDVTRRFGLWTELSFQPTWKYGFATADVCGLPTGCAPASRPTDPSRYVPLTAFQAEAMYELVYWAGVSVGYVNLATQQAPDGSRRPFFWSPGAQFYFDFTVYLDGIYDLAHGEPVEAPDGHGLSL